MLLSGSNRTPTSRALSDEAPRADVRYGVARGRFVVVLIALGAVLGCSGPRYEYPPDVVRRIERGCQAQSGGDACLCVLERMQDEIPYEDLQAFEDGRPPYERARTAGEASPEWEAMNKRIAVLSFECEQQSSG